LTAIFIQRKTPVLEHTRRDIFTFPELKVLNGSGSECPEDIQSYNEMRALQNFSEAASSRVSWHEQNIGMHTQNGKASILKVTGLITG
jgi:hypothetical protein